MVSLAHPNLVVRSSHRDQAHDFAIARCLSALALWFPSPWLDSDLTRCDGNRRGGDTTSRRDSVLDEARASEQPCNGSRNLG